MRKLAIAISTILILVVLSILATPFVMGFWLQKTYPSIIAHMNSNPGFSAKITSFHRGWFSSKAKLQLTIQPHWSNSNNKQKNSFIFTVNQKIEHGPFILDKTSNGSTKLVFARALIENNAKEMGLNFSSKTLWSMNNQLHSLFSFKNFLLKDKDQQLVLQNLTGQSLYNINTKTSTLDLKMAQAQGQQRSTGSATSTPTFVLQNLSIKTHLQNKMGLFYGTRQMNIGTLTSFPKGKNQTAQFIMKDCQAHMKQTQDNDKTNIMIGMNIKSLHSQDNKFNIGPLMFSLSLTGLNTQALAVVSQNLAKNTGKKLDPKAELQQFYHPLMQLLSKGLQIHLQQLNFMTQGGPVNLQATIQILAQSSKANIMTLASHAKGQAMILLPKTWVIEQMTHFFNQKKQETPQVIANTHLQQWIKNGMFIEKGSNLIVNLTYGPNGRLLINGKTPNFTLPKPPEKPKSADTDHTHSTKKSTPVNTDKTHNNDVK